MIDKELKKLKRLQILEMFLQEKEKNERLELEIMELEEQLDARSIDIGSSGSMAEAALKINGVYDAAEKAAEQYLDSLKAIGRKKIEQYKVELERDNGDARH